MTTYFQRISIALLLTLVPGTVLSQEQQGTATQQVKQPETPASQQTSAPIASAPADQQQAATSPAAKPDAGEGTSPYIIKKGDTLWDISSAFLKDPFLWPFLWKANPAIVNPDLIYPGSSLTIPSLAPVERALKTPASTEQQERLVDPPPTPEATAKTEPVEKSPSKPAQPAAREEAAAPKSAFVLPEEKPSPLVDKHTMLSSGYIDDDINSDAIVGSPVKAKAIFAYDEIVYVTLKNSANVNIGDKFMIYTPLAPVIHPKTKKSVGRLIRGLGILQVIAKDMPNLLTARITLSYDAIEIGNLLTPYQEPTLIYQSPVKKTKDITGIILEVRERRSLNAQTDVVYLDKGSADGVEAGDRFTVFAEHQEPGFPRRKIGEVQVIIVKERTSTAVVRKSLDSMGKGEVVEYKQ